jgi:uncharacterized protein YecT (DUF1311 family)
MANQLPNAVQAWHDEDQPDGELSNAAMKERARLALIALSKELDTVYAQLLALCDGNERAAIERTQSAWLAYLSGMQNYAREKFRGGTLSGLAAADVAIAETERRLAMLATDIRERMDREG